MRTDSPNPVNWTALVITLRTLLRHLGPEVLTIPWHDIPPPLDLLLQDYASSSSVAYAMSSVQGVDRDLVVDLVGEMALIRLALAYQDGVGLSTAGTAEAAKRCVGIMLAWAEFTLPRERADTNTRLGTVKWLVEPKHWQEVLAQALGRERPRELDGTLTEAIGSEMETLLSLSGSPRRASESGSAERRRVQGWVEIAYQLRAALNKPDTRLYGAGEIRRTFRPRPVHRQAMDDLQALIEQGQGSEEFTILGVVGAPGIGKTTLLEWQRKHLKENTFRIAKLFLLGESPRFLFYLRELAVFAGHPMPLFVPKVEDATGMAHTALQGKRVFLALDDVRAAEHVRPFLVGGQGSVLVIGTHSVEALDDLAVPHNRRVYLDGMTEEEGLALCELIAGPLKPRQREIAKEMGRLVEWIPLAVESLAAQCASVDWAEMLATLKEEKKSPTLQGETVWDRAIRDAQESVWKVLEAERKKWLLELARLPQASSFDVRAVQSVTGLTKGQARDQLYFLARRYVLRPAPDASGTEGRYRMHWLWWRFAQCKAEAAGLDVKDTAWTERYAGVLVKQGHWWWPSYRAADGWQPGHWFRRWHLQPVSTHRRNLVKQVRSFVQPYYEGIEEAWAAEGIESDSLPVEVHGTRLLLRRRSDRYALFVVVSGIVLEALLVLSRDMQATFDTGPFVLPGWIWAVLVGVFALAVWIFGVHLVNLYRFMDRWVDGRGDTEE